MFSEGEVQSEALLLLATHDLREEVFTCTSMHYHACTHGHSGFVLKYLICPPGINNAFLKLSRASCSTHLSLGVCDDLTGDSSHVGHSTCDKRSGRQGTKELRLSSQ